MTSFTSQRWNIDVVQLSHLPERNYLGPKISLASFSSLLRSKAENPKATMIALFVNAIYEVYSHHKDQRSMDSSNMMRLHSYMPITRDLAQPDNMYTGHIIRLACAQSLFWNYEELFNRFKAECRLDEISKAHGLRIKVKPTIIQSWAMQLRNNATQLEFETLLASGHHGSGRYVEWETIA